MPRKANSPFWDTNSKGIILELSQLTDYAAKKYGISEEFKWDSFPGFSVLADPVTGSWAALLMRTRDDATGKEIQRCDIRCGQRTLSAIRAPFVTLPFRMTGYRWVGVVFDETTVPEVVFSLFDRAIQSENPRGYTVQLNTSPDTGVELYRETPLPTVGPPPLPAWKEVPAKIIEMKKLFGNGGSGYGRNAERFYRQAKFMEDYEDDAEWTERFTLYYPTYNDLSLRRLRGYFGWRSRVRKGVYGPISASLAYLYLYELLCGIGAAAPEEAFEKMKAFEAGFIDSGVGEPSMRRNLHRWMFEYAVIHHLPAEAALEYADPKDRTKDAHLAVLKVPKAHTDEEIFSALLHFTDRKPMRTVVCKRNEEEAKHLFAAIWRHLSKFCRPNHETFFTSCFGRRHSYRWAPLSNAIHREEKPVRNADYDLSACRSYRCRDADVTCERLMTEEEQGGAVPLPPAEHSALSAGADPLPSAAGGPAGEPNGQAAQVRGLDAVHTAILTALTEGEDAAARIRAERLIPSVVADRINEALFDEIGDNALECDGSTITLVEDYRDDLKRILRG